MKLVEYIHTFYNFKRRDHTTNFLTECHCIVQDHRGWSGNGMSRWFRCRHHRLVVARLHVRRRAGGTLQMRLF